MSDNLIESLLSDSKVTLHSDYPIKLDRFDIALADDMREAAPAWPRLEEGANWKHARKLMDTLFHGLYQPIPQEQEELTNVGQRLRDLYTLAKDTKEWRMLRVDTVGDEVLSSMAAMSLFRGLDIPEGEGELLDEEKDRFRQSFRKAVKEAEKEVEIQKDAEGLLAGYGTGPGGEKLTGTPSERIEFASKLKQGERLQLIAKLAGRFARIAEQQYKHRVDHGRDELADLELGNYLPDVVPDELMHALIAEAELLFLHEYAEERLLQYKYEGVEKVGRGPIVAMIDTSGSMCFEMGGADYYGLSMKVRRIDWAISISLALSVYAKKQNRDLHLAFFDTRMGASFTFPKGDWHSDDIIRIAQQGCSGGTSFGPPLEAALRLLRVDKKADFLFITDGEAPVSPELYEEYRAAKEALKFRTFSILIGEDRLGVLPALSDSVATVNDLVAGHEAVKSALSLPS